MSSASEQVILADSFFSELAHARSRVLLLNYDATVAPSQIDSASVVSCLRVAGLLQRIVALDSARVALITAGPAINSARVFSSSSRPEIWGSDGLERLLPDGTYSSDDLDDVSYELHAQVAELLVEEGLSDRTEVRPGSIIVHWAGLPEDAIYEIGNKVQRVDSLLRLSPDTVVPFQGGLEIRLPRCSKRHVVQHEIKQAQGSVAIAYLGDSTDEDAFRLLKGKGLSVLVHPEYRSTSADLWLMSLDELIYFLQMWISACSPYMKHVLAGGTL